MLSKRVDGAHKSELKNTPSALKNILGVAINKIKDSIESALAESLRSNYTATKGNEPNSSQFYEVVEANASALTVAI